MKSSRAEASWMEGAGEKRRERRHDPVRSRHHQENLGARGRHRSGWADLISVTAFLGPCLDHPTCPAWEEMVATAFAHPALTTLPPHKPPYKPHSSPTAGDLGVLLVPTSIGAVTNTNGTLFLSAGDSP